VLPHSPALKSIIKLKLNHLALQMYEKKTCIHGIMGFPYPEKN
jgi:hypothetical protein